MSRVSWSGWFSLEVPDAWEFSEADGVITICDPINGCGALQASIAHCEKRGSRHLEAEAVELARDYAAQRNTTVSPSQVKVIRRGETAISQIAFAVEDDLFVVWHVIDAKRVVFITYTVALVDKDVEKEAVGGIVDSLSWDDSIQS